MVQANDIDLKNGDRVRIKPVAEIKMLPVGFLWVGFLEEMEELCGREFTVDRVHKAPEGKYIIFIENDQYNWTPQMLEKITDTSVVPTVRDVEREAEDVLAKYKECERRKRGEKAVDAAWERQNAPRYE